MGSLLRANIGGATDAPCAAAALTRSRRGGGGAGGSSFKPVLRRVLLRGLKMFLIGAVLNLWASNFHFGSFGIMGVLQRIALCYVAVASLYLFAPLWAQRAAVASCVIVYVGIMYGADVPGCGRGVITEACNAGAMVDRAVFVGRMAPGTTNAQGLVSTLTAIATTQMGCEYGCLLLAHRDNLRRLLVWWSGIAGAALVCALALSVSGACALNKKVWSVSFVFAAGAVSGGLLSLALVCVDMSGELRASDPSDSVWRRAGGRAYRGALDWLRWHGRNPLVVFVGMVGLEILLLDSIKTPEYDGSGSARVQVSSWLYLYRVSIASWMGANAWASSAWALLHVGLWTAIVRALDARKKYITL